MTTLLTPPLARPRRQWAVAGEQVALVAVAAAAWAALLLAGHSAMISGGPRSDMPDMPGMSHSSGAHAHGLAGGIVMWGLMTVAMMSAGLAPMFAYVRRRALRRRWQAAPTVTGAYFGVWLVVGVAAVAAGSSIESSPERAAVLLGGAALWQLTPCKRWAMAACTRPSPLRMAGLAATGSELGFGARQGAACVASCWALMLPMALAGHPPLWSMVVATGVVTVERLDRRPDRARRLGAVALAAAALVLAVA
jgi:predicted metal-binding membrane protein